MKCPSCQKEIDDRGSHSTCLDCKLTMNYSLSSYNSNSRIISSIAYVFEDMYVITYPDVNITDIYLNGRCALSIKETMILPVQEIKNKISLYLTFI